MLADVSAFADDATEVRHSKGDESYRATDGDGTGNKAHNSQQKKRLPHIRQLDFSVHMLCQSLSRLQRHNQSNCKERQREQDIPSGYPFKAEVCSPPEIVLLKQISIGSICHDNRSERAYESTEQNTECDKILGADPQSYEETDQSADQSADEAAHRQ